MRELKHNYCFEDAKVLGTGAFGTVVTTTNRFDQSIRVAIKILDKAKLKDNLDNIIAEIATLNTLDHPNIVKYYETYNDAKFIYLVMEYVTGMPMYDKICSQES